MLYSYQFYRNNAKNPQENIVKEHCENTLRNSTAKLNETTAKYLNKTMAKLTKNMEKLYKTQLKMRNSYYYM